MTLEEAARILDPETTRESLRKYGSCQEKCVQIVEEACRVAVLAIRNGHSPLKIKRENWKPCGEMCRKNCANCDHCADELWGDANYCKDCQGYSKWETSVHKYCERCGRPRNDEAWAELERRLNG